MDVEDKTEGLRVTRARKRRLSTIDLTDSRPSTPLLEIASDRVAGSPRPTRRALLNNIESGTPIRTTRSSVARGETPEPLTPSISAAKRSATKRERTAGVKAVRKQLLGETINIIEDSGDTKMEALAEVVESAAESNDAASVSPTNSLTEKRVTRSMSSSPAFAKNASSEVLKEKPENAIEGGISSEQKSLDMEIEKAVQITKDELLNEKYSGTKPEMEKTGDNVSEMAAKENSDVQSNKKQNLSVVIKRSKAPNVQNSEVLSVENNEKIKMPVNIEVTKKETPQKAAIEPTKDNLNIQNIETDKNNDVRAQANTTEDVAKDLKLNKSELIKETKTSDLTKTSVEQSTDTPMQKSPKETGIQEHDATQKEDTSEKIVVSKEEASPEKNKIFNIESPQKVDIQNSEEDVKATEVVDKGSERINTESSLDTTQKEANTESPQKVYIQNSDEGVNATEVVDKGTERINIESSLDTTQKAATLDKMVDSMEKNPENFKVSSTESPQKVPIQNSEEGINSSVPVDKCLESLKPELVQENKKSDLINTSVERLPDSPKSFKEMQCEIEAQQDVIQEVSATNLRASKELFKDFLEKPQKLAVEQTVEKETHQSSEMDTNSETDAVQKKEEKNQRKSIGGKIIKIEKLPPLTPNIRSRTISGQKQSDQSKHSGVAFTDSGEDEKKLKRTYPKTPTRMKPSPKQLKNPGTPSLPGLPKTQKSSTPLNTKVTVETKPTPSFIDGIKPFAETSFNNVSSQDELPKPVTRQELSMRLISDNEDEDDEEIDKEVNQITEFVEHEVEVAENYISGESMDSEMRMEMQENEIPVDGESLYSEDTSEDEISEDEESNSFIVSDTENLVYSTDEVEEGEIINTSVKRKYRRIVDQEEDEEEEAEKEPTENEKLSEAAQLFYESVEKIVDSAMKETNSEQHDLNETDCLNKTATRLQVSEDDHEDGNDQHSEEGNSDNNFNLMYYDEDDSVDELEPEKSLVKCSASIYEVLDSNDENHSPVMYKAKLKDKKMNSSCIDITRDSSIKDKSVSEDMNSSIKSTEALHKKQKCEEEKALLDEISATDLTHLKQLFNPLQKSRRQTLYMPSPEEILKKPKLKRRSELLNSNDFNPSQSFIESINEIKKQHAKRKRLSKSFSCVTEELEEEPSAVKKTKMHTEQNAASENKEEKQAIESEDEVVAKPNEHQHKHNDTKMLEESKATENEQKSFKDFSAEQIKPMCKKAKKTFEEKNVSDAANKLPQSYTKQESGCMNDVYDKHMKYCESLIQAANLAKLEQKKQQIALGKKKKRSPDKDEVAVPKSTTVVADVPKSTTAVAAVPKSTMDNRNIDSVKPAKLKKNVKRLQAVKQAAKHAIQLLAPDLADIPAKSLRRKLSPQPPAGTNAAKRVKRKENRMNLHASPAKSSDEENRSQVVNLIKTSAGYVTESMDYEAPKKHIEFIKLSSGIMRVEACSPEPKYFRELPSTPTNLYGFRMEPKASKTSKPKRKATNDGNQKCNYATESAMRFKSEIFTRKK